jgi:hypothetical protein
VVEIGVGVDLKHESGPVGGHHQGSEQHPDGEQHEKGSVIETACSCGASSRRFQPGCVIEGDGRAGIAGGALGRQPAGG